MNIKTNKGLRGSRPETGYPYILFHCSFGKDNKLSSNLSGIILI